MKRTLLLLVACTLLPSCEAFNKLTPEQQARLTAAGSRLFDKALMLGEARLDKALGLPPQTVVVPIPAGVAVKVQK